MKTISLAKLTQQLVTILDNLKCTDILVCDTQKHSVMFDKVIIATCNNPRQAQAAIRDMHKAKLPIKSIEGQKAEEWLLADCGRVVVHMMLPKIREYFRLEELWQNDPAVLPKLPTINKKAPTSTLSAPKKTSKKTPSSSASSSLRKNHIRPRSAGTKSGRKVA